MLIRKATGRQTLLVLHSRLNLCLPTCVARSRPSLFRPYKPATVREANRPRVSLWPHKDTKVVCAPEQQQCACATTPKLGEAKEEALHDIHDAEAHGILEPPPPGANWFRRTLHQGIQLFKFYFRGVKLIFTRRKTIAAIKARISAGGAPLTRAEYRLIQTQKDDINNHPFLIIALLLEEVIPLIAIYAPSCCPPPASSRRSANASKPSARKGPGVHGAVPQLEDAPTAVCGLLGLSTIGLDILRMRRIRRHLEFITRDDQMLLRDTRTLSRRELTEALEERGIRTSPAMTHKDLQARLLWWLDAVKDSSESVDEVAVVRRLALVVSLT
ncbi:hypothetical protein BDZ97DRAFT_1912558 [Flammula alnicola]|nr:hypothetical protein BDZ97DRAFT_1912558 [Flammula alnicola]